MAEETSEIPREIKEPIEKVLAEEAREIYLEETGKQWEEEPPSEEESKEYIRKAARRLLEKWQKTGREYYSAVKRLLGAPPPREDVLVYRVDKIGEVKGGKLIRRDKTRFEILPLKPKEPPEIPPRAILKCPECGTYTMKQIMPGLWQCTRNPFHTISTLKWFPRRR